MATLPDQSLGTRTLRGMFWAYGAYVGGRGVVLVSTAILARLLTPADFGLVALALVFTTFVWTVVIGGVLALVVSGLSPLVAQFFGHPDLRAIIPVLGLSFFFESLG